MDVILVGTSSVVNALVFVEILLQFHKKYVTTAIHKNLMDAMIVSFHVIEIALIVVMDYALLAIWDGI